LRKIVEEGEGPPAAAAAVVVEREVLYLRKRGREGGREG